MSDALPLPPRPHLGQYQKLAKELQQACKSDEPDAVRAWAARWLDRLTRSQAWEHTPEQRLLDWEAHRLARRWRRFTEEKPAARHCRLTEAQFFVSRAHGFTSWPRFAEHVRGLATARSPVALFERAADAIVAGDAATLAKLLRAAPQLVRARSGREHRSTLLHYVSANGVEDYRQRTPKNIVQIARMLLDAGTDVNAESDAYGGHSTTLGLAATSWHPEHAGVQVPLLELLLARGAKIDGPDTGSGVNACL